MINPAQELLGALCMGLLSALVLWIARRWGFFLWKDLKLSMAPVSLSHVLIVFAIYFAVTVPGVYPLLKIVRGAFEVFGVPMKPLYLSVWLHLTASAFIVFFFFLFGNGFNPDAMRAVWRTQNPPRYSQDVGIGILAWIISFPLVLFSSEILNLFIYVAFHVEKIPDQTAVEFLRMTLEHPFYFFLNVLTVVGFAPVIEELMFRGFLQTFARRFLHPWGAISVSSLCFSLFHFTFSQGYANISIIGSLFLLAFFLGFVYERQGSLLASISLHATFNAISILNLYFLGGTPWGPV